MVRCPQHGRIVKQLLRHSIRDRILLNFKKVLAPGDATGGIPNKKIEILKKSVRFDIIRDNSIQR
jgi:hypothetical protein